MRIFVATSPDDATPRTTVPAEILRRLAFGRPQRRPIQPAPPTLPVEAVPPQRNETRDLDQRVRESGEW